MKQLSSQDAVFLYLDSRNAHLTLTALNVYQQPRRPHPAVTFDDVVRHVGSRLHAVPLLRQKLARPPLDLDYPYWVDAPDFELEAHVLPYRGPAPRTVGELFDAVAGLHAQALDLARPPWEMHVIEDLGPLEGFPENCFALVTRYHHAAIDGASGTDLVRGLHGIKPGDIEDYEAHLKAAREPGALGLLARAALNNLRGQYRLVRSIGDAAPGLVRSLWDRDDNDGSAAVPYTRFNRPVGPERVFHAMSIPLAEIRAVRDSVPGATVNDIILTACAGGLRSWLKERDELPEVSLVGMVPVNLRTGDETVPGNRLAMMFIPIHTDIARPLARLRAVHERTRQAKKDVENEVQERIREITDHIPAVTISSTGRFLTGLGLGRHLRLCNCTITNVPSPDRTLYLGRARMVYTTGAGPILDGMGLIISLFTYAGQVNFSFTSCPNILPEPRDLARHVKAAFEALRNAAQSPADT